MSKEFKKGDIVRYSDGCTALVKLDTPHAGGWHGTHCLGGSIYVSSCSVRHASDEDVEAWYAHRRKTLEQQKRPLTKSDLPPLKHQASGWHALTFAQFARANFARCEDGFSPLNSKDGPWWGNAMAGECGKACNVVKKMDRDGASPELMRQLAHELADVVTYADLLAQRYGIDLGAGLIEKFNIVSKRVGSEVTL